MAKADTIKKYRVDIRDLTAPADAEPMYDQIQDDEELTAADKQKLTTDLQVKVNGLKQAEHDEKAAAGDKKGAEAAIAAPVQESDKFSTKKKLKPVAESIAESAAEDEKPIHVPEGCSMRNVTAQELEGINKNPEQAKKLVGVKPIFEGKGKPACNFIAIMKAVIAMVFMVAVSHQAFAALASDDVGSMTDFTQTKGFKVNASGNVVPVTDSSISLGASGTEWSAIYVDTLYVGGGTTSIAVPTTLTTNAVDVANSIWGISNGLNFEGATADAYETSVKPVDPTADQIWSIPNFAVNAAFMGSTLTTNTVDAANSVWFASNSLLMEGATADAYELTIAPADVTADRTVTVPDQTGTVMLAGAATVITAGASPTLTVAPGNRLYTDTITTDNQDQTITFSAAGAAGDTVTVIFVTDGAGSNDEVITFHSTLCRSTGTLTLANAAASRYVVRFMSDGSKWNEISRTAVQAA